MTLTGGGSSSSSSAGPGASNGGQQHQQQPAAGVEDGRQSQSDLWVNRYAPTRFEDAVGNGEMLSVLQQYCYEPEQMPSLILAGPPGCGKTTAMHILAHHLHGDEKELHCMELNASDQRGIDVIREQIVAWLTDYKGPPGISSSSNKHANGKAYRIVILDEFDSMTLPAQEALRKVMEQYSDRARFALACNHPNKILDAIISRCSVLKFQKIEATEMLFRVVQVCKFENLSYDAAGLDALVFLADGDMRKAITMLQAVADRVRDHDDHGSMLGKVETGIMAEDDIPQENKVFLKRAGDDHDEDVAGEQESRDVEMAEEEEVEVAAAASGAASADGAIADPGRSADGKKDGATESGNQGEGVADGEKFVPTAVTRENVLQASDAPNPDVLKACVRNCLFGRNWQTAFYPIVKLEREGYPLRDVMVWLSKVLLYSLDDLDERVRADVLSDVSEAHAKMVRCNRFSLLQIDALLMRLRMKYNLREIQGIM